MAESCRAARVRTRCQLSVKSRNPHCANVGRTKARVPVGRGHAAAAPKTAAMGEPLLSRELAAAARRPKNCTRPSLIDVEQPAALPDEHRRQRPRSQKEALLVSRASRRLNLDRELRDEHRLRATGRAPGRSQAAIQRWESVAAARELKGTSYMYLYPGERW